MKKLWGLASLVLTGTFAITLLNSPSASAATPPDNCFAFNAGTITDYYDNEANNTANPACPRDVDIPSTIGGVAVTAIGNYAFGWDFNNEATKLTAVTIPSSITTIGVEAFAYNQLTTITIPDSVTSIGTEAFTSNQLTTVTIPDSVTSIGNSTFSSNQLTTVTIPDSVTSIGGNAFSGNQLTTVTIPDSVTSIGNGAFANNQLTALTIPGNPANLGTAILRNNPIDTISYNGTTYTSSPANDLSCFAFDSGTQTITNFRRADLQLIKTNGQACLNRTVDIPETIGGVTVAAIGYFAFSYNQLTAVTIPNSVTTIDNGAFSYNQLTAVTIPNSITTIGSEVFRENQLTTVTIPDSVTTIGDYAFVLNQLTAVTIPDSVTAVSPGAFALQSQWGRALVDPCRDGVPCMQSSDPAEAQRAYDSVWYVRLYTGNPANPNNLQNGVMSEDWWFGIDYNADNKNNPLGGHIINPSSTTVTFKDQSGQTLRPSQTITGKLPTLQPLSNYYVSQGPQFEAPIDGENPTPAEQQTLDDAFTAYYRLGQQQTFAAPVIAGYTGPAPASPYTTTLAAADNTVNFVYTAQADDGNTPTQPGSGSNPNSEGELADTGVDAWWLLALATSFVLGGIIAITRTLKHAKVVGRR